MNKETDSNVDTGKISLVCNLTERAMIDRLQHLKEEIFNRNKITAIEELETGYSYRFDQPIDFSLKLIEFINFERKCCPGESFALSFDPDEGPIRMQIYGSQTIRDIQYEMISSGELKELL